MPLTRRYTEIQPWAYREPSIKLMGEVWLHFLRDGGLPFTGRLAERGYTWNVQTYLRKARDTRRSKGCGPLEQWHGKGSREDNCPRNEEQPCPLYTK